MENVSSQSKNKIGENYVDIIREKFEKSSPGARVLHKTSDLIISRRCQDDNDKEMYKNFCQLNLLLCSVLVVVVVA